MQTKQSRGKEYRRTIAFQIDWVFKFASLPHVIGFWYLCFVNFALLYGVA